MYRGGQSESREEHYADYQQDNIYYRRADLARHFGKQSADERTERARTRECVIIPPRGLYLIAEGHEREVFRRFEKICIAEHSSNIDIPTPIRFDDIEPNVLFMASMTET